MRRQRPAGLADMRSFATRFPTQLREGFAAGREARARIPRDARHVVVTGMGGSAIAADLVRCLTEPEAELQLEVNRGPTLPRSVDRDSVTIFASYSGDTWEALSAYDEAGRRAASRVVLASAGALAQRAERDGTPLVPLPPGWPPRSALGSMLGGLLGLLDPFFPESNEDRLSKAAVRVEELQAAFASARGEPANLARAIAGRTPVFYADLSLGGLARRWKDQVEENAKRLAEFDMFPELFHNAIVGWDAMRRADARRWAVVVLEWPHQPNRLSAGIAHLQGLLRRQGVAVRRVAFDAEDRLEALVTGVSFGDHVSLFLAEAAGIDPLPVPAIARLKRAVGHR
ncbi:MAG TPA: SIS domain-containing protein [Thermoplasmata archaeon]|nr:SIS domain-containing protein [Thermoplasmata archaeon]